VDNDPIVLAHARVLLQNTTPEGVTAYVEADYHDPELIIARAREHLDFDRPIAVMLMGVLGHAKSLEASNTVVSTVVDAVPSGSYLAVWDGNDTNEALNALAENYAKSGGVPYIQQPVEHIRGYFAGLELVEPGLVPVTAWRPDPTEVGAPRPLTETTGGVARKP
jgi:hypothetical protein